MADSRHQCPSYKEQKTHSSCNSSTAKSLNIVHYMRDGEKIRARILSPGKPLDAAVTVTPTLEDSYMWLLRESTETG